MENALKVVKYLENQPQVEKVNHPSISKDPEQQALYKKYFPNGGGSIFTFEIKGGAEKAQEFIDNLELFSLLANVADVKSLAIHPASTTHSECNEAELLDQESSQTRSVFLSVQKISMISLRIWMRHLRQFSRKFNKNVICDKSFILQETPWRISMGSLYAKCSHFRTRKCIEFRE